MTMRSALGAVTRLCRLSLAATDGAGGLRGLRFFSDGKGKVLSEEERAAESIYIQKMEKEKKEKLKLKQEKEKAQAEKDKGEKK